jgi:MazG family protein
VPDHPPPSLSPEPAPSSRPDGRALERLVDIMARLRSPGGCPWDLEQDLASIRPYLVEETYEVLEALDSGDVEEHRKELGDLLLQIVFQARLREEDGAFGFAAVADAISDKLVRRHPHVFGDVKVSGSAEVLQNWAQIKLAERRADGQAEPSALDGVPKALPALVRSERLGEKAARVGFDWLDARQVRAKVDEELGELDAALAGDEGRTRIAEELGDALFAMAQLARFVGVHPEDALREAATKFERRFRRMERSAAARGFDLTALDAAGLDALWNEAKKA